MSSIHTLLEQSAKSLGCRYEFAELTEANATIFDRIKAGDFPVCLVLPFDINDSRANGLVTSTAEINAIFLTRYESSGSFDKPSAEVEAKHVDPMRSLARQFINILDNDDLMAEEGIQSNVLRSVHEALFDCHLYGCWAVFTPTFSEDLTTCDTGDAC